MLGTFLFEYVGFMENLPIYINRSHFDSDRGCLLETMVLSEASHVAHPISVQCICAHLVTRFYTFLLLVMNFLNGI